MPPGSGDLNRSLSKSVNTFASTTVTGSPSGHVYDSPNFSPVDLAAVSLSALASSAQRSIQSA